MIELFEQSAGMLSASDLWDQSVGLQHDRGAWQLEPGARSTNDVEV